MYFGRALRSFGRSAIVSGVCFGAASHADPIPVIEVSVGGADSFATLRANVVSALGSDALADAALAQRIDARLGRPAPATDGLASSRAEVGAAVDAYFARGGPRESRRRLDAVIESLERDRIALEARPENLAALLRALAMRARIALEAHAAAEATALLARAAQLDPTWSPDPHEFPPSVVNAHRAASARPAPHAELSVETPDEACTSTLDGRSPTRGRRAAWSAAEGIHRVVVRCENSVSRVHPVTLSSAPQQLRVDPRVDSVVQTATAPRLVYASAADARAHADADASSLARSLDARRVVLLDSDGLRVIDAASGRSLGALPPSRAAEVATLLSDTPQTPSVVAHQRPEEPTNARPPEARPPPLRPSGVAPVALVIAGALFAGTGAVFLGLHFHELGRVEDLCPGSTPSAFTCSGEHIDEANVHRTSAVTDLSIGIPTLAVGDAALVGGVIWYALAQNAAPRVSASVSPAGSAIVLSGTF